MAVENSDASNEYQVRKLMDEWATAFRERDVDRLMSCYAPDIVAYDIVPPLQYRGADAYRKDWEQMMSMCEGQLGIEMRDVNLTVGDDLAFSHCLSHCTGKQENGGAIDLWTRVTVCFRKMDGRWFAVHEHVSAPIDMQSGQAMLDMNP